MIVVTLVAVFLAAFQAGLIAGQWYANRQWSRLYAARARAAALNGAAAAAGLDETSAVGVQQG